MHFSTIAITLFGAAASASASTVGSAFLFGRQLPACSNSCTGSADFDGCAVTDTHCLCTSKKFVDSTTSCVEASCTGADLTNALQASVALCAAVGVDLTSSSTTSSASSTSSSSSTSAASSTPTTPSSSSANSAPSNTPSSSASTIHGANTLFGFLAAGLVALTL